MSRRPLHHRRVGAPHVGYRPAGLGHLHFLMVLILLLETLTTHLEAILTATPPLTAFPITGLGIIADFPMDIPTIIM